LGEGKVGLEYREQSTEYKCNPNILEVYIPHGVVICNLYSKMTMT
jgi:hypothetical protein